MIKTRRGIGFVGVAGVLASCLVLAVCSGRGEVDHAELLEFNIWHTENAAEAQNIVIEAAAAAKHRFEEQRSGYHVEMSVSYQPWGDLSQKLFRRLNNPPDVSHLQPFMVYQVWRDFERRGQGRLHPLTQLVERLEAKNGPIVDSLRRLHSYTRDGQTEIFAVPYAVGSTMVAYRADFNTGQKLPTTWLELPAFAEGLAAQASDRLERRVAPFILPGADKFFIDQLFNEIVVSMGGSLYDAGGGPNFDTQEVRDALAVMIEMIAGTNGKYFNTTYLDQFTAFARGDGAVVPVTYGRASAAIEAELAFQEFQVLDFGVLNQPGHSSREGSEGTATIDAEPWVVFPRADLDEKDRSARLFLAEMFLEEFYEPERYLRFCGTVPVHLRPIFPKLWPAYDELSAQARWHHWAAKTRENITRHNGVAPILMTPNDGNAAQPDFLLDLSRQSVISDMVNEAWQHRSEGEESVDRAIATAQVRALALDAEVPGGGS